MDKNKAIEILDRFTIEKRGNDYYTDRARFKVIYKKNPYIPEEVISRIEMSCKEFEGKCISSILQLKRLICESRPLMVNRDKRKDID